MQDRLPLHPGRIQLTPVEGQANTYDLIRKDEPIVDGSVYSKGNVLPDDVCDALGIDRVTSEPKDALMKLAATLPYVTGNYVGNGAATRFVNLGFTPRAVIVFGKESQYGTEMGIVSTGRTITAYNESIILRIDSNGFTVGYSNLGGGAGTNRSTSTYTYIAFK